MRQITSGYNRSRCFRGRLSLLYAEDPLRVRWGGKGPLIQTNKSATLSCNNDQYLFVPKKCFNQVSQSAVYREDTKSVSLTCCGGSYGGGAASAL